VVEDVLLDGLRGKALVMEEEMSKKVIHNTHFSSVLLVASLANHGSCNDMSHQPWEYKANTCVRENKVILGRVF